MSPQPEPSALLLEPGVSDCFKGLEEARIAGDSSGSGDLRGNPGGENANRSTEDTSLMDAFLGVSELTSSGALNTKSELLEADKGVDTGKEKPTVTLFFAIEGTDDNAGAPNVNPLAPIPPPTAVSSFFSTTALLLPAAPWRLVSHAPHFKSFSLFRARHTLHFHLPSSNFLNMSPQPEAPVLVGGSVAARTFPSSSVELTKVSTAPVLDAFDFFALIGESSGSGEWSGIPGGEKAKRSLGTPNFSLVGVSESTRSGGRKEYSASMFAPAFVTLLFFSSPSWKSA